MSIALAVMSHGLFASGSGTFPDPYDVRFGVDNGDGSLGTLTSPDEDDVRSGVEYGGDGDQYTGTLYVPSSVGDPTWTEDSLELFIDLWTEFGQQMLTYSTAPPIKCIKTPLDVAYEMQVSGYNRLVDTQIDVLRSEATTAGFYNDTTQNPSVKRPKVVVSGETFQIEEWQDDDTTDAAIKLLCSRQQ